MGEQQPQTLLLGKSKDYLEDIIYLEGKLPFVQHEFVNTLPVIIYFIRHHVIRMQPQINTSPRRDERY